MGPILEFQSSSLVLNPGCTELYVGHHDAGFGSVILCQCNLVSFSLWVDVLIPIIAVIAGVIVALDYVPLESAISGLHVQLHHDFFLLPISAIAWLIIATVGAYLVPDDFEVRVTTRTDLFVPVHERLFFLGNGQMRTLVAKEIADVWRSGTMFKMLGSYCVPLLFLLALAWMADFATNGDMPIPINLLSYAPFLGFFGFNFYSWLNAVDSPDFLQRIACSSSSIVAGKNHRLFLDDHGFRFYSSFSWPIYSISGSDCSPLCW